jgi:hypothetical protein
MARKISVSRCFVVVTDGYGLSLGTPDEMYYEGESDEETARARAAAQAEADKSAEGFGVRLTFRVLSLDDFFSEKASDDRAEGRRNADSRDW